MKGEDREGEKSRSGSTRLLLLREGGSSESIRTVSPADAPPFVAVRSWHPHRPTYHLRLCSSVFSPFSFYYREESKVVRVGGSAPEARAAIFISLLPSTSTLSSSYDLSFRLLHLLPAWSYDLHPSCLAELTTHPLSPPSTSLLLSPLSPSSPVSLSHTWKLDLWETSTLQPCLSTSSYSCRATLCYFFQPLSSQPVSFSLLFAISTLRICTSRIMQVYSAESNVKGAAERSDSGSVDSTFVPFRTRSIPALRRQPLSIESRSIRELFEGKRRKQEKEKTG